MSLISNHKLADITNFKLFCVRLPISIIRTANGMNIEYESNIKKHSTELRKLKIG